ncbi:MAG: SDR family NAD(P)-dependent oxidoreductase [Rhodocyclaceae bacterium]|nr:SDR family NAD(P)-dependent oxidoreductase [Rhodocyclaceae bacterium]
MGWAQPSPAPCTLLATIVTHTPGNTKIGPWQREQAAQGYAFAAYGVDVSDYESSQELARRIHADDCQIDILVNNAGITRDATLRKLRLKVIASG